MLGIISGTMRKRSEIAAAPSAPPPAPVVDTALHATSMAAATQSADDSLSEGERLTLTVGKESYSPIKYQSFEVGPFQTTIIVRAGETASQAVQRGYRVLLELQEAEFQLAWGRHRARSAVMLGHGGDR